MVVAPTITVVEVPKTRHAGKCPRIFVSLAIAIIVIVVADLGCTWVGESILISAVIATAPIGDETIVVGVVRARRIVGAAGQKAERENHCDRHPEPCHRNPPSFSALGGFLAAHPCAVFCYFKPTLF
jgi:hypothetical protein